MYAMGRGTPADTFQAQQWFEKALAQDLSIAQQNLTLLKHRQTGYTLVSQAVDIQMRSLILTEESPDLNYWLELQRTPSF